MASLPNN